MSGKVPAVQGLMFGLRRMFRDQGLADLKP